MSNGGCNSRMHVGVLQCGSAEIDSGGSDIHIKQIATAPDSKDPDGWRGEGMQVRSSFTGNLPHPRKMSCTCCYTCAATDGC